MANDFRVLTFAAEPASTSDGSEYHIYTTPSSTTTVVIGLILTNIHTSQVTAKVLLESDTSGNASASSTQTNNVGAGTNSGNTANTTAVLLKDVPIPVGSSLELLSGGKVILQPTDSISISCSVADKLSGALSIMEIT
tara:strand:+ start:139 stop:552 length:414 start_codon:yes stop_codon:yes gene_type:complete